MVLDSTEAATATSAPAAERGRINPDGSISLGIRPRNQQVRMLPTPSVMRNQNMPTTSSPYLVGTSTMDPLDSLNNNNRLPPMTTSYPSPAHTHSSLSPNTFLSPSRKRSFASVDQPQYAQQIALPRIQSAPINQLGPSSGVTGGRLNNIESILNPPGHSDAGAVRRREAVNDTTSQATIGAANTVATSTGQDVAKLDRREQLKRERELMRQALEANERELEELGD